MARFENEFVEKAVSGDQGALESLILGVKDQVYNLSLRMLWNPADAEDVTQEILIKVITNLSKFRFESQFSTWVYRIAANHLINTNKRGLEHQELSFEIMERGIEEEGFKAKTELNLSAIDRGLLAEELKISCTHAMLLCLDREYRMTYILSSIFQMNSVQGGEIMGISPEAYRKRLSRARDKMRHFMEQNCGQANEGAKCRCEKRVEVAAENRRINPKQLIFVNQLVADKDFVNECKDEMEKFDHVSAVFLSNPYYLAPESILQGIKRIITSGEHKILGYSK